MADAVVVVNPVKLTNEKNNKNQIVYLAVFDKQDPKAKDSNFLALKLENDGPSYVRLTGIWTNLKLDKIMDTYQETLANSEKEEFQEILVPWTKISYIRNLFFKQK